MIKFYGHYKPKTFAANNMDLTQKLKFGLKRVENNEEKGENAGTSVFLKPELL